jgi:hypothetical protein
MPRIGFPKGYTPANKTGLTDLAISLGAWMKHDKSVALAAREVGITRHALRGRVKKALAAGVKPRVRISTGLLDEPPPPVRSRAIPRRRTEFEVPMSEDAARFHEEWTADQCVAELRKLALAQPDKVITRNFFRNEARISEATWNRYFGTFEEFKRQAGITLSRHAHRLERSIAKHAAADSYRVMNADKAGWEGAFLRPDTRRYQTVLVGSDIHDKSCDPFWRHCFIDTARRVQPEKIVLNGDLFDLAEFGKYTVDPRDFAIIQSIRWVQTFLRDMREAAPDAEITAIEGNHEFRLIRHLAEATPALRVVLSELHGFTVPKLLGLEEFEVNYIARMDLAAWTERDVKEELKKNYAIQYGALLWHHFPEGRLMGFPGANGHHHKLRNEPAYSPTFGSFNWHQLGCGHARSASYTAGEKWQMGFMLAHVDTQTKHSVLDNIEIKQDFAIIGGQWYRREDAAT